MAIDLSQFITGTFNLASSGNVVFSSAVSSGSLIVAHVGYFNVGTATFSNILDNVNANNYTIGCNSTMSGAGDTAAHAIIGYKTNISSGAIASTYRISANYSANVNFSMGAAQYTGGPFTAGSTKSANGTSSSPAPGAFAGSSTPLVFVASGVQNSTGTFNSTINTGAWRATVDPTNVNQVLVFGDSTNSSLTQNPTFGMNTSTRWLVNSMVFMGLGSGGAVTRTFVDAFPMLGCV